MAPFYMKTIKAKSTVTFCNIYEHPPAPFKCKGKFIKHFAIMQNLDGNFISHTIRYLNQIHSC